ncbi:MAG TPA: hypothetical protein VM262_01080 [Acidimicrobiales bacterium]|nr:hypothetical protein [Acidimicrobiales bacterium]
MRIVGEYRESINAANHEGGGIHDDTVATKLGFRGGTVAGSIHLDLFPPLLLEAFGKDWFETGSLSIDFKNATVSREPVRAGLDGDVSTGQVRAWIERDDGMLVGEGTAAVGSPDAPTALRARDLAAHPAESPRILAGLAAGDEIPTSRHHVGVTRQEMLLDNALVTEPLDWYRGDSPWGGAVVAPQQLVHVLYTAAVAHIGPIVAETGGGVGLFGAIEIANLDGPLQLDRPYDFGGRILAIGESPRTEYTWFEVTASDDATPVSCMLMQLRWMKASSPLYA